MKEFSRKIEEKKEVGAKYEKPKLRSHGKIKKVIMTSSTVADPGTT